MQTVTSVRLARDCQAIQIPAGLEALLPAGTMVDITQTLGGSYTVQAPGGLFRIAPENADALGIKSAAAEEKAATTATGSVDEKAVWDALRDCYDPEIPVNIVDLGLVYDMRVDPDPSGGSVVSVKMTLTATGCGMGGAIAGDAQRKLMSLPGVSDAKVDIVWEPPWHHSMITEAGKRALGLD